MVRRAKETELAADEHSEEQEELEQFVEMQTAIAQSLMDLREEKGKAEKKKKLGLLDWVDQGGNWEVLHPRIGSRKGKEKEVAEDDEPFRGKGKGQGKEVERGESPFSDYLTGLRGAEHQHRRGRELYQIAREPEARGSEVLDLGGTQDLPQRDTRRLSSTEGHVGATKEGQVEANSEASGGAPPRT